MNDSVPPWFLIGKCHLQGISSAQPAATVKCSGSERSCGAYGTPPLFSRPTRVDPNLPRMGLVQPVAQGCSLTLPEPPMPQFARPNRRMTSPKRLPPRKPSLPVANGQSGSFTFHYMASYPSWLISVMFHPHASGIEWSPRMDVAESGRGYVLTLEIPGVCAKDIRVEVNDRK